MPQSLGEVAVIQTRRNLSKEMAVPPVNPDTLCALTWGTIDCGARIVVRQRTRTIRTLGRTRESKTALVQANNKHPLSVLRHTEIRRVENAVEHLVAR